jgi:hypothetical protein
MNPEPVPVTMHALTLRGFVMQPELLTGLASLTWLGRGASLHLSETRTGITAFLRCPKAIQSDDRWTAVYDASREKFTYCAVFESESAPEIIGVIKNLVDRPAVFIEAA